MKLRIKRLFWGGVGILVAFLFSSPLFSQESAPSRNDGALQNRSTIELMRLIVDHQMEDNPLVEGEYVRGDWDAVTRAKLPKTMYWSYPTGVTLLAMQRVYDVLKDDRILKYVQDNNRISSDWYAYLRWQKAEFGTVYKTADFEKLWRLDMLDDCGAMGAAILETKLRHGITFTPNVEKLVDIIGNYVTKVQFRLPDGTFWRPNSPDGLTIWADDLYMSLPCLIRWAEYKNHDAAILDDAALQIINYARYLQDADGVFLHAYFVDKQTRSCCKWGRANGWVAVAIAEVLSVLPKDHPKRDSVLAIAKKQLDGLIKYQSESGLWHQVLDHPELTWGTETSCSAQFAYALARGMNRGWLDSSYGKALQKAFAALKLRINPTGGIDKVSRSTSIGNDLNYYNTRPTRDNDHHGNGLVLLALAEIHTLFQHPLTNPKEKQ
jgi:unsaturated rhamnogalacturonyl hydrolase